MKIHGNSIVSKRVEWRDDGERKSENKSVEVQIHALIKYKIHPDLTCHAFMDIVTTNKDTIYQIVHC